MKEYAMYKGDELITVGTVKEIAEELNIKPSTVYFYTSPSNQRRAVRKSGVPSKKKIVIRLDD